MAPAVDRHQVARRAGETAMSSSSLASSGAWRRDTLTPGSWYERLAEPLLDALAEPLREVPDELTTVPLPETVRDSTRAALAPSAQALEHGTGFVVIESPRRDLDDRQRKLLYWLVGQALGTPVPQNVQGVLLYDVRDTGDDVRSGARFSVTNAESSFHTDASFFDDVVDYVGLLCLRDARAGGISQLVDGRAVYEELAARHPEALAVLGRPFHIDRRGGTRPDEAATALFPVVQPGESGPLFRYLRYWIEAGHVRAGVPLTAAQAEALGALDGVLAEPALRAEFFLRPGEMLFINNRWLLHNRTAFEDHPEPQRRRHLVRLWVARR
jgi:alpha-ketoglutarate-dependent taurine dioxygenase